MLVSAPITEYKRLKEKLLWLVKLRWLVFLGLATYVVAYHLCGHIVSGENTAAVLFTTLVLGAANFVFHLSYLFAHRISTVVEKGAPLFVIKLYHRRYWILCFLQVFVDYFCVTYLIDQFGFLRFNLATFYLPHVIITTIIFERKRPGFIAMWVALILIFAMTYLKREEMVFSDGLVFPFSAVGNSVVFVLYNIAIFHFIFYLVSILSSALTESQAELQERNRQLIEVDREKQSYTLRATHELKAPFAAIQSYLQVLLDGYVGEIRPEVRQILEKIDMRCNSLSIMIKHIIQLSNLKTSVFEEKNFEDVQLLAFLRGVRDLFLQPAEVKKIQILVESELSEDFKIAVLPSLFQVLIDNLVSNALQYSHPDSKIFVRAKLLDYHGRHVEIAVTDQGIGIPTENLENIFKEHFRCNNAVKFYNKGNGMGLAIVKEIVRLHQGEIVVASKLGEGTTFTVTLPVKYDV